MVFVGVRLWTLHYEVPRYILAWDAELQTPERPPLRPLFPPGGGALAHCARAGPLSPSSACSSFLPQNWHLPSIAGRPHALEEVSRGVLSFVVVFVSPSPLGMTFYSIAPLPGLAILEGVFPLPWR